MTLNLGDPFEVKHQDWIRQRLPSYEQVWQKFIGNNGFDWPLPMEGLTAGQEEKRKAFYQAHYTVAIQCFSIDQSLTRVADTLGRVKDVDDLHKEFDFLVNFINAIGIVRDNFVIMDNALDLNGTIAIQLQEFYRVRSHVLHGPHLPYAVDDGYLKIPPIANENETPTDWHNRALWEDMDTNTFVFAADFCSDTGERLFALIARLHAAIYSAACSFFAERTINWSKRKQIISNTVKSLGMNTPLISMGSGNVGMWMLINGKKQPPYSPLG